MRQTNLKLNAKLSGPPPIKLPFEMLRFLALAFPVTLGVEINEHRSVVEIEQEVKHLHDARTALVALALRNDLTVCRLHVPIKPAVPFLSVFEAKLFGFHALCSNRIHSTL